VWVELTIITESTCSRRLSNATGSQKFKKSDRSWAIAWRINARITLPTLAENWQHLVCSLPWLRSYYSVMTRHPADSSLSAREGLAVLIASTVVVLKFETSILRQSHNFISIVIKFGVSWRWVGRQPCREAAYRQRLLWLFNSFLYSPTELQPIPVNRFTRTIAQKTRSGVRKTLLGWEMSFCEIWGCFILKIPLNGSQWVITS